MTDPLRKIAATGGVAGLFALGVLFVALTINTMSVDIVWRVVAVVLIACTVGYLISLACLWGWPDRMDKLNRWIVKEDQQ